MHKREIFFRYQNYDDNYIIFSIMQNASEQMIHIKDNGGLYLVHDYSHDLDIYFDSKVIDIIDNDKMICLKTRYKELLLYIDQEHPLIIYMIRHLIKMHYSREDFLESVKKEKTSLHLSFSLSLSNLVRLSIFDIGLDAYESILCIKYDDGFYYDLFSSEIYKIISLNSNSITYQTKGATLEQNIPSQNAYIKEVLKLFDIKNYISYKDLLSR